MSHTESEIIDQHYTISEVAHLLHVHPLTVRHWYWEQGLRIQRVGKQGVRIAARDLKTFLSACNHGNSKSISGLDDCDWNVAAGRPGTGTLSPGLTGVPTAAAKITTQLIEEE
jgi:excisionase family DNA binding protein